MNNPLPKQLLQEKKKTSLIIADMLSTVLSYDINVNEVTDMYREMCLTQYKPNFREKLEQMNNSLPGQLL